MPSFLRTERRHRVMMGMAYGWSPTQFECSVCNTEHVNVTRITTGKMIHNSERIGKEDSLSVWWSVNELEGFFSPFYKTWR